MAHNGSLWREGIHFFIFLSAVFSSPVPFTRRPLFWELRLFGSRRLPVAVIACVEFHREFPMAYCGPAFFSDGVWHTLIPGKSVPSPAAKSNKPLYIADVQPNIFRQLKTFAFLSSSCTNGSRLPNSQSWNSQHCSAETFRVYFIPACTDSRNTILAAAPEAVCILTRWPYVAPWPLS